MDDSVRQGYRGVTCAIRRAAAPLRRPPVDSSINPRLATDLATAVLHCASVIQAEALGAVHRVNRDLRRGRRGGQRISHSLVLGRGQGFTKCANVL